MSPVDTFPVRRLQAFCTVCVGFHLLGDSFVADSENRPIRYEREGGGYQWTTPKQWHRKQVHNMPVWAWCPIERRWGDMIPKGDTNE